jgi:hypothetical protein
LVESKYKSGKSSKPNFKDPKPCDQLAMEWDNLVCYAKNAKPYILYATADMTFPNHDIEESEYEFKIKRGGNIDILWISWRELPILFQQTHYKILRDLVEVLKNQGLTFFQGFNTKQIKSTWVFGSFPLYKWDSFKSINVNWSFTNG